MKGKRLGAGLSVPPSSLVFAQYVNRELGVEERLQIRIARVDMTLGCQIVLFMAISKR
jgi:hypothetical protein